MSVMDSQRWSGKILLDDWVAGGAGVSDVVEPASGETLGQLGLADVADVRRAAARAKQAQRDWAATRPSERAAILRRAGQLWLDDQGELRDWLVRETGSTQAKAGFELSMAAQICFTAAGLLSQSRGEFLPTDSERWSFSRRLPAGVVTVIAPFNVPLLLAIRSVAPALALGNAVLLKPDPRTAVSGGVALARVFQEAGLPAGLLQLLPGGAEVGEATVSAPEVSVVSFTGSTSAGRAVGRLAAGELKRVHLELGGKNSLLILPGAELGKAVSAAAFGSYFHQGQICMSTGRHLVHESDYESYLARLVETAKNLTVGDPYREDVAVGPIIDQRQFGRIDSIVQDAVAAGARLETGGAARGLFYRPTVLSGLSVENPAWQQEIFGPVAPVLSYRTIDEAIQLINDTEYGLSVGILGDLGQALHIADRVESGKVHINEQTVDDEPYAPFGGVKDSGNGARFGGTLANIEAFTETQWVTVRSEIAEYPY